MDATSVKLFLNLIKVISEATRSKVLTEAIPTVMFL